MATHETAAATHASLALTVALMKRLANNGMLKDGEAADIINSAIYSVAHLPEGRAIIAVLLEISDQLKDSNAVHGNRQMDAFAA